MPGEFVHYTSDVSAAAALPIQEPKRILIVDDDPDVREVLADVLADAGYDVVTAPHGEGALERLHEDGAPSLVILDLMMPGLTGDDVMAEMRKDVTFRDVPVVVLSAASDARLRARAMGARGCLQKPVDLDRLLRAVDEHIRP